MPVAEVQKLIHAIDNNKTEFNSPPLISKKLRKLIEIQEPENMSNELKQTKDELNKQMNDGQDKLKQMNDELKQQMNDGQEKLKQMNDELKQQIKDMQELLGNFIKNSNANNDNSK